LASSFFPFFHAIPFVVRTGVWPVSNSGLWKTGQN
jgi:hypothetical protein